MSSIVNKIKDAVSSDKHHHHNTENSSVSQPRTVGDKGLGHHTENAQYSAGENYSSGGYGSGPAPNTEGPHRSDAMNKMDPRIDSDRDGSKTLGQTENTYGSGTGYGTGASHTAGPHRSDAMNKVDPRIDSDRDGSNTLGRTENTYGSGAGYGTGPSHTAGPHRSDAMNKVDPRVDSDRDGSNTLGSTARDPTFGQMPLEPHSHTHHTAGPHRSDAMNKADPRIDSDRDGRNAFGGNDNFGHQTNTAATGFGTGPAPNTAGPHRSDAVNKMDPRIDSDRDGSKTLGRDQTYSQSGEMDLNPRDAADVPPSVLRKHVGEVSIEHGDHGHHRERRHSKASAQETFRGV